MKQGLLSTNPFSETRLIIYMVSGGFGVSNLSIVKIHTLRIEVSMGHRFQIAV